MEKSNKKPAQPKVQKEQKVENTVRCFKTLEDGKEITTTFNKEMWKRIKNLPDTKWHLIK